METTVRQRLIEYLEYKGIGRNKFETIAGLSLGYITKLKNAPGADKLVSILSAAPDLNREWLLTGEGEMLKPDVRQVPQSEEATLITTNSHGVKFYDKGGAIMAKVPMMKFKAFGSPVDDWGEQQPDMEETETMMVEVDGVHQGNYILFEVDNDSMDDGTYLSFRRGDKVLVRDLDRQDWAPKLRYTTWPFWVIATSNCIRLKQIVNQDEEGNITLHSVNPSPEYTDFQLSLGDVTHLYNVVRKIPKVVVYGK